MWIKKKLDKGWSDKNKTNVKTIQQYIETYAGPNVMMYKGYAILMNTSLVTFTFGLGLPILFPISLLALVNHYICEKISFAYIYRKPPMYGNQINDGCLNVLKFAPILMMSMQYLAFSNQAIFKNKSSELEYKTKMPFVQPHLFQSFN